MGAYMLIIANSSDALYFPSVEPISTSAMLCNYMPGNLAKLIGCFNTR